MSILALFSHTGSSTRHFKCPADLVDIKLGIDITKWHPTKRYKLIIAHPPCTYFTIAGARWWHTRPNDAELYANALALVGECFRIAIEAEAEGMIIENPRGRLGNVIKPTCCFNGTLFGDEWSKFSCYWCYGKAVLPPKVYGRKYKLRNKGTPVIDHMRSAESRSHSFLCDNAWREIAAVNSWACD
jgi:hypothetical protein